MTPMRRLSERGLTLTEVTIVMALASIVMLGLVGFYMNSQATWMDASAQAITQREATALLETIAERVHQSARATVTDLSADGQWTQLDLFDSGGTTASYTYRCEADSLVYEWSSAAGDWGAAATSKAEQFQCVSGDSLVQVTLQLRSAEGQHIQLSTALALINRHP
jgi:prepilin-type N-terminal cleavage/methylation domain-containing protein